MDLLNTKIEDDGAYGTVDVQISPIGDFKGSSADGKPIPEHITKETLTQLADSLNESNDEILVDVDHKSTKSGNDKDTKAAGWLSKFIVDPIKGLFAKMKLTRYGRDLVDSREYRHLSPVFALNANGEPIELHSVGMTNRPALSMKPILNSEPNTKEIIEMEITKDDLIQLIKDTVAAMNEAPVEEVKEEKSSTEKCDADGTCDTVDTEDKVEEKTEVSNACGKAKVVKNEEVKEDPAKTTAETPKAPEDKEIAVDKNEEKKEKEIIKIQALNSTPSVGIGDSVAPKCGWETKHGKAFFDELKKMGYKF